MKGKKFTTLLGFACVLALAVGFAPTLYAGENDALAHMAGGAWVATSTVYGNVLYGTSALTNNANGRSASGLIFAAKFDFTLYGWFNKVAPVQGPLAFIMISKAKGRNLNSTTAEENGLSYVFVPGSFTDADNDSLPDDPTQYVGMFADHSIVRRVASAVPSLPSPEKYPPKPPKP
jgi:hypothetical protein